MPRYDAYRQIHFPSSEKNYALALRRLKFDELFFAQLRMNATVLAGAIYLIRLAPSSMIFTAIIYPSH